MNPVQIYLSMAPLTPAEADIVAQQAAQQGLRVSRVVRQPLPGGTCLAGIEAERTVGSESPVWCLERLAAGVWNEIGRFARITAGWQQADDEELWFHFEETDYQRLMAAFRLSLRRRV
ncbi:hypothetical protein N8I74_06525 [Chitiniphilus purpureus]|uniref:Uncharacterized protein n=1 Tax=Chitiniphilus purpureus TaxID=2981137 RepID=A0ABY6DQP0_9NEIS|nr:hypothetical protein [Chitiniphilus sp. CD1]UXY16670.1 hypothetical protein N8I74_06525 [Chitiniphilus sp. CD1]